MYRKKAKTNPIFLFGVGIFSLVVASCSTSNSNSFQNYVDPNKSLQKNQVDNFFLQYPNFPEDIKNKIKESLNISSQNFANSEYMPKLSQFVEQYSSTLDLFQKFESNFKSKTINESFSVNEEKYNNLKSEIESFNQKILNSSNFETKLDEFLAKISELNAEITKNNDTFSQELSTFSWFNTVLKHANLVNLKALSSQINDKITTLYKSDNKQEIENFTSNLLILENIITQIKSIKNEYSTESNETFNTLITNFNSNINSDNLINNVTDSIENLKNIQTNLEKIVNKSAEKNEKLQELKKSAISEVDNAVNLSQSVQSNFKEKINSSITESQINQIKEFISELERVALLLSSLKTEKIELENKPNYLNSENKTELDDLMSSLNFLDEQNKLVLNDEISNNTKYFLSNALTVHENVKSEIARLNGDVKLKEAKKTLENQLLPSKFSPNFVSNIKKLADSKKLVSDIKNISSHILKLADSLDLYNVEVKNSQSLLNNSSTSATNKQQLEEKNTKIKQKLDENLRLNEFDSENLPTFVDEFANLVSSFSQTILDSKTQNNQIVQEKPPVKIAQNLSDFKQQAQDALKISLDDQGLDRHSIKKYLTSASFNLQNANLWLKQPQNDEINFKLLDLSLDSNNRNILVLKYEATSIKNSSHSTTLSTQLLIPNSDVDLNKIISSLNIDFLDDYFDIYYNSFLDFEKEDFPKQNVKKFISQNFSQSKQTIGNFFHVTLPEQPELTFTSDNKVSLNLDIKFNSQVIKTVTVKSKNHVSFKEKDNLPVKIGYTQNFKNTSFYNQTYLTDPEYVAFDFTRSKDPLDYFWQIEEPSGAGGVGSYWFYKYLLKPALESLQKAGQIPSNKKLKTLKDYPKVVKVSEFGLENPTQQDELSKVELDKIFDQILKDQQFFSYEIPENATISLSTFDVNNEKRRVLTSSTTQSIYLKLLIKKGQDTKEEILQFAPKDFLKPILSPRDKADLSLIKEILSDSTGKELFKNTKINNIDNTHGQISLAGKTNSEIIGSLNKLYTFGKIGKFEIFAKDVISTDILKGQAKIFFWYKYNGLEYPLIVEGTTRTDVFKTEKAINFSNWLPATYSDIKPKNGSNFTSDDFSPIVEKTRQYGRDILTPNEIPNEDKSIIDNINSRHFDYRRVTGEFYKKAQKEIKYRLIDPADIVEQKAESKLNYLLQIKANSETARNSDLDKFKNQEVKLEGEDKKSGQNSEKLPKIVEKPIFFDNDPDVSLNTSKILKDYFVYYYDVKTTDKPGEMTFKLGFINKHNTKIRYSSKKDIKLQNLENDYKNKLYPEVILNGIKYSDFVRKNTGSLTKNVLNNKDFKDLFDIKEQALKYNNFKISKENLQFLETKKHNNKLYFRLKYVDGQYVVEGSTWYFLTNTNNQDNQANIDLDTQKPLVTLFESQNEVTRSREIEPYYKDLYWNYDNSTKTAKWTLKEKYFSPTFLNNNPKNRKIKLQLFGNALVQNTRRLTRISGGMDLLENKPTKGGYDFVFDFEKLAKGEIIAITEQTKNVFFEDSKKKFDNFSFNLSAQYIKDQGIEFKLWLNDPNLGLIVDNVFNHVEQGAGFYSSPKFDTFDPKKAFILHKAGARVHIEYTNSLENEDFGSKTNQFDYKNIDYTNEEQPISFFTNSYVYNLEKYNPNQNVPYKLHEGYLQDLEFLHKSWDTKKFPLAKNLLGRTFGFSFGSATMLAKVNNDPDDGKFYIITNNHVEGGANFDLNTLFGKDLTHSLSNNRYMAIASKYYSNSIDGGYSYWGGPNSVKNVPAWIVWTGIKQPDVDGKNPKNVDITVLIVDIKPLIKAAYESGEFQKAAWLLNWYKLPNLKLNSNGQTDLTFFGQNVKHFGMNGFPYAKQSGYVINRANSDQQNVTILNQKGYTPSYFNAGNSGTGVLGPDDEYISTINGGSPLTFLQSWNYSTASYNYFGINWQNEKPLELKSKYSLSSMIMRLNAQNPREYSLPWFFKDFEK
ncbi:MGA_1079 family surface serine endopeptidase [Mesomycoplasma ovipneumoniae]|uniref:MGA_1079 family surface serine endopeptidase n=1 Tax=Mesomycoplasma ovipneumoniae TaxID=29562 RepID=UPI0005C71D64|nr:GA module-containing protein [Mesomycoplasma ovipneumoniae]